MKINQYDEFIMKQVHGKRDFLVSEQLTERLKASFKITDENARKILQRTVQKGLLKSSSPLTFGKRSYAYYLPRNVLDVEAIKKISQEHRQPLYRLLCILEAQGGVISQHEAFKAVASPVELDKSKVTHLTEFISSLVELKIVEEYNDKEFGCYYVFRLLEDKSAAVLNHNANMALDSSIIPDVIYWLREHNLIDNKYPIYRNKANSAIHNNLVWDAFAYTRTSGIKTEYYIKDDEMKNILVVLDVVISRDYTAEDLHGFYDRIQLVRNSTVKTVRKVFPIAVFKKASADILLELNKLGFMKLNIGTVFGTKIYEEWIAFVV
jgi:hypothetical protein